MLRNSLSSWAACVAVCLTAWWHADPVLAQARPAFAPPGGGQSGLAVGVDSAGALRAKSCSKEPCSVEGGLELGVIGSLRSELPRSTLAVVGIGKGRRVILVTVPGPSQSFQAVVAAALDGGPPRVLFAGWTGPAEGNDGVRQAQTLTILEPDETGARAILLGTERDDLNLCGRPALLDPRLLNPADLSFRPAKFQRLSQEEREAAVVLRAERAPNRSATKTSPGLVALGATSAIGAPQFLTDGRLETAWAENRGGSGRGEFVMMSASEKLPITAFEIVLTSPGGKPDPANVPRALWLVTRERLYQVIFPPEAATEPGARFRVTLPKPDRTDCVAQVLESTFRERGDARVSVAELHAKNEFEGATPSALVSAIRAGGERAQAAGSALSGLGASGFTELAASFPSLDEAARRIALDAMDRAPCSLSVAVYVIALEGDLEAQRLHAESRLRRCGRKSADALSARLRRAKGDALARLANELALVAPDRAVSELTPALAEADPTTRRVMRVALARATTHESSREEVRRQLRDPSLSEVSVLDLLRALGERSPGFLPESGLALERLSTDASFRGRYLLIEPAARLSGAHAPARKFLDQCLLPQPRAESWIRLRAIELAPREPSRAPAFLAALSDANVRVREAAAQAIGQGRFQTGTERLIQQLSEDPWPLARTAAARALGALSPEPRGNQALVSALSDEAPAVRSASAEGLGRRRVSSAAPKLRDLLTDAKERFEVRQSAASALGELCDHESAEALWKLVRRLEDPLATPEERAIGEVALFAAIRIAPRDLNTRLEPLRRGRARKAVERAWAENPKHCQAR